MQWILTLLGLALGWVVDESFADALIGALVGLGIAQTFGLSRLAAQAAKQQVLLQEAQQNVLTLDARLAVLERGKVAESSEPASAPEVVVPQAAKPETRTEPELVGNCRQTSSRLPRWLPRPASRCPMISGPLRQRLPAGVPTATLHRCPWNRWLRSPRPLVARVCSTAP
uniref:hypothetical protein n=1 Tax=Pseudomonas sp. G166 TaxID=3094846 RepID=UPI00403F06B7